MDGRIRAPTTDLMGLARECWDAGHGAGVHFSLMSGLPQAAYQLLN